MPSTMAAIIHELPLELVTQEVAQVCGTAVAVYQQK